MICSTENHFLDITLSIPSQGPRRRNSLAQHLSSVNGGRAYEAVKHHGRDDVLKSECAEEGYGLPIAMRVGCAAVFAAPGVAVAPGHPR